jgi:NAD(P)-dependent dehydrogenase (short-subunit alcohol dehydrogenase family)
MAGSTPRLANKVALVTGGGTGIGRATALLLAREGASVALLGRRPEPLDDTAAEVGRRGGRALPIAADVTDEDGIRAAVQFTLDHFCRIDVLVNNAGVPGESAPVHETSDRTWWEITNVNLNGCFRVTRAVLPCFLRQGEGAIVNVSSTCGLIGAPGNAAYSVAKAGVIQLTKCVALEYAASGIRCNCVCPGTIDTDMTKGYLARPDRHARVVSAIPQRRIGGAPDVAEAILYLASDESAYMTGAVLTIDGGLTAG